MNAKPETPGASLREFALYFLKLGCIGFGRPIALVGFMQRDLVETRKWIDQEDYMRGLAFSQLAPGPLAAQDLDVEVVKKHRRGNRGRQFLDAFEEYEDLDVETWHGHVSLPMPRRFPHTRESQSLGCISYYAVTKHAKTNRSQCAVNTA
jgi:hypothetical protein